MAWYRTGTLEVTNGSTTVTGTGTQFTVSKGRTGDNIVILGTSNEIASVNSDTSITLAVPFNGASDSGITDWSIIPTQSRTAEMNDAVAELVSNTSALAEHISIVGDTATLDGDITGNAATVTKWATGRTIALTGDVTGTSTALDGSANLSFATVLSSTGVSAGTYKSVTVDVKGRVTAGTNPTTLAGYGITDGITAATAATTYLPLSGGTVSGTVAANNFSVQSGSSVTGAGIWGIPSVLAFNANSAEGMRLTSTGLGIGTTNPGYKLDVAADARVMGNLYVQPSTTTANALARFINTGGTAYVGLDNSTGGLGGPYSLNMWHSGAYPIVFGTNGVEKMRLTTSGYLGIGLTSPGSKLHVNSDTGIETFAAAGNPVGQTRIGVAADGTSQIRAYASMPLVFAHDNLGGAVVERMRIITNGNVGIGTTSPIAKLEVSNGGAEGYQVFPDWAAGAVLTQARSNSGNANINHYQNALSYIWLNDGTEKMRFTTAGSLGIGTASPGAKLDISGGPSSGGLMLSGTISTIRANATTIDMGSGDGGSRIIATGPDSGTPTSLSLVVASSNASIYRQALVIEGAGHTRPGSDNTWSCGTSANRWTVVYAASGSINTSDEREKEWRGKMTEAELAAGKQIIAELGFYQWKDAIEVKGSDARYHFGAKAQTVWNIMAQHGLVESIDEDGRPGNAPYGFLCYDEWIDEEGEAQNRFGLRPDELTMFLVAVQEARLAALEAPIH